MSDNENRSCSENESDDQDSSEEKLKSSSISTSSGENDCYADVYCEAAALQFFPHMSISYPPKTVAVTIKIITELFFSVVFYTKEALLAVTRLFRPALDRRGIHNQIKTITNKLQSFI